MVKKWYYNIELNKRGYILRVYLDNCSFNRPFDDQNQLKIKLETEAKLFIQQGILTGKYELVWSYILEFENNQNQFDDKRNSIYGKILQKLIAWEIMK
jgi:hypothetical protein